MSASSFLAASSRRRVLGGLDASLGQVEERYVGGHCFPLDDRGAALI